MGALKIAATAPVDPQAVNKTTIVFEMKNEPNCEPIAEPVNVIGASNPTEPRNLPSAYS